MVLIQILIIGWISDLLARIAVAFACWNFLLFLSLKTKKKKGGGGQKRQLYPYVANESTHNVSLFFFAKNSEVK